MCYSDLGMDTIKKIWPYILGSFLIVLVGVGAGWLLTKNKGSLTAAPGTKVTSKTAGIMDESKFEKEAPEGLLEEGGVNGEGQYHLTRPGGVSQNVYLTSTSVDLSLFVGKKVKVWGQTLSARKAGWLMDVGKIQVVE